MPRSIWSALRCLRPPGDAQPDLGHAAAPPLPPSPPRRIFLGWISAVSREKIARAGGGMVGRFLFCSPSEWSKLDLRRNTSVPSILPWIYGCREQGALLRALPKFVFKRQKRLFPKQITGKSLTDRNSSHLH